MLCSRDSRFFIAELPRSLHATTRADCGTRALRPDVVGGFARGSETLAWCSPYRSVLPRTTWSRGESPEPRRRLDGGLASSYSSKTDMVFPVQESALRASQPQRASASVVARRRSAPAESPTDVLQRTIQRQDGAAMKLPVKRGGAFADCRFSSAREPSGRRDPFWSSGPRAARVTFVAACIAAAMLSGACHGSRGGEVSLTAAELDAQCPSLRKGKDGGPPPPVFHSADDCPSVAELRTCSYFGHLGAFSGEFRGVRPREGGELACVYSFEE